MSRVLQFPATITLDRTADGRFRAELAGDIIEAETVAALLDALKEKVVPSEETDEDDPGGPDFDADLEYVLTKNTELYRRLAQ